MLMSAERQLLIMIARQAIPTWCLQYLDQPNQSTFRRLHKQSLVQPSEDYEHYHISERGRAALEAGETPHRTLFDGMRDSAEEW